MKSQTAGKRLKRCYGKIYGLQKKIIMKRARNKTNTSSKANHRGSPPLIEVQKVRDVDFVFETNAAKHVYLCGDFNNWEPESLCMSGNPAAGLWEKRLALPPGRYEYKFNVDGKWMHDPGAPENIPNTFGTMNSVLEVTP
jgi:1,4-alpha-glucan branching enzyme